MVIELKYSGTNTYLVRGTNGSILFDTGWAGSFPQFCRALGAAGATVQEIQYLFISHFHPDHMGIAQEIANCGVRIIIFLSLIVMISAMEPIMQFFLLGEKLF